MRYDDAALERALAALPLEETPADLHRRILLATIDRPAIFQTWELWVVGAALAVCTWLILTIVATPHITKQLTDAIVPALTPSLFLWLSAGAVAAAAFQFTEKALAVLHRARP